MIGDVDVGVGSLFVDVASRDLPIRLAPLLVLPEIVEGARTPLDDQLAVGVGIGLLFGAKAHLGPLANVGESLRGSARREENALLAIQVSPDVIFAS